MTTTTPTLATGGWVQYNATVQNPQSPGPSAAEQTIGLVRQIFTAQGKQFYQVVWNPGSMFPETGLYSSNELTPLSQQSAQQILSEMNAETYSPANPNTGSNYKQPNIPQAALPPDLQGQAVTPTLTGSVSNPLDTGPGYYNE